jgi:anti-sigma factor RsiW
MCDFSGRLIAWMDGELDANQAAVVEQHLADCAECQTRVAAYQEVSRGFATYYDAVTRGAMATQTLRKLPRWVAILGAAAAAMVLLMALIPRSVKQVPAAPQVAVAHPPIAVQTAANPVKPVGRTHAATRRKTNTTNWALAEPGIQIAIPADAMFPPGAVPEGVNYIANLSLADGSVQAIRLQPQFSKRD